MRLGMSRSVVAIRKTKRHLDFKPFFQKLLRPRIVSMRCRTNTKTVSYGSWHQRGTGFRCLDVQRQKVSGSRGKVLQVVH